MSNLRKAILTLSGCEEWSQILSAACAFKGITYDDKLGMYVTLQILDDVQINSELGTVCVNDVEDQKVLDAIDAYMSTTQTKIADEDVTEDLLNSILLKINTTNTRIDEISNGLLTLKSVISRGVLDVEELE